MRYGHGLGSLSGHSITMLFFQSRQQQLAARALPLYEMSSTLCLKESRKLKDQHDQIGMAMHESSPKHHVYLHCFYLIEVLKSNEI